MITKIKLKGVASYKISALLEIDKRLILFMALMEPWKRGKEQERHWPLIKKKCKVEDALLHG